MASASSVAEQVADAGDGAVHPGAAHLLERHLLPDDHLRHARAAEVHRGVALDHDDDVGERGDVGAAGRRRPEQAADLRHLARQRDLVVEDPPGAAAAREHLDLVGDPRAGGVDEPEDRQLLAQRHLGGPHDLLDGAGAPRAGLDGRVVGDDDRRPAVDGAAPGDDAVGRAARPPSRWRSGRPRRTTPRRTAARSGRGRRACSGRRAWPLAFAGGAADAAWAASSRRRTSATRTSPPSVGPANGAGRGGALLLVGHGCGLRVVRVREAGSAPAQALGRPRPRAMTMRCTSEVPSPISRILASR